jgi:hypothetical protein
MAQETENRVVIEQVKQKRLAKELKKKSNY